MHYSLKRNEILRGVKNFRLLYKEGRTIEGKFLRCSILSTLNEDIHDETKISMGIKVGRLLKRAVDRNLIKRLVRESYRKNKGLLKTREEKNAHTLIILFSYKPKSTNIFPLPSLEEIEEDVVNILTKISQEKFV